MRGKQYSPEYLMLWDKHPDLEYVILWGTFCGLLLYLLV